MKKATTSRPHDEWLREQLQDPEFVVEYVTAAAEDEPAVHPYRWKTKFRGKLTTVIARSAATKQPGWASSRRPRPCGRTVAVRIRYPPLTRLWGDFSTFVSGEKTREIFEGDSPDIVPRNLLKRVHGKLLMLYAVADMRDLRVPPANRLEKLHGERAGQHSIRINDQFRICFSWRGGDACQVEIVEHH